MMDMDMYGQGIKLPKIEKTAKDSESIDDMLMFVGKRWNDVLWSKDSYEVASRFRGVLFATTILFCGTVVRRYVL